jgi:hypothetical protein
LLSAGFVLFVFDRIVFTAIELANSGTELIAVHATMTNSLFAVLLWLSSSPRLWRSTSASPQADPDPVTSAAPPKADPSDNKGDDRNSESGAGVSPPVQWQDALLFGSRIVAAVILLLTWLGYTGLVNFLFHRIVLFALLLMLAGSVRTIARWGLNSWGVRKHQAAPGRSQQGHAGTQRMTALLDVQLMQRI